jgi:hypothetical protein
MKTRAHGMVTEVPAPQNLAVPIEKSGKPVWDEDICGWQSRLRESRSGRGMSTPTDLQWMSVRSNFGAYLLANT